MFGKLEGKKWIALLCLITFIVPMLSACEPPPPPAKISFSEAMKKRKELYGKRLICDQGVAIFKKQKEGTSIVVVTELPYPEIKTRDDLTDNQVMAIWVSGEDFEKIKIGGILSVDGNICKAEKKSGTAYYLKAGEVNVVGHINIEDSDFGKLVDIISQKIKDDEDFMDFAIFFFVIMPMIYNMMDDD